MLWLSFNSTVFANNSTLDCKFQNTISEQLASIIECNLSQMNTFSFKNRMKINYNEINLIAYAYRKNIQVGRIKLGTSFIGQINCSKFLGLYIYSKLNFCVSYLFILIKYRGIFQNLMIYCRGSDCISLFQILLFIFITKFLERIVRTIRGFTVLRI